ncbi:hypothetical protein K8R62_02485, partial [bacterium]|nr:hypothetical protein [bacterium]
MVLSKKIKKTSKTRLKTSEKGKPKKSRINVRVVEEPVFEVKKEKKVEESKIKDFDFKKEPKKKEDISPKKSKIFHQYQPEKSVDDKKEYKLENKKNNINNKKDKTYQSFNMYKKLAVSFILLTLLLLFLVFYFSFNNVSITLYPREERISDNIILDIEKNINNEAPSSKNISGDLEEVRIEVESEYPANGTKEVGVDIIGKVEVVNDRDVNQVLVATTRLLSPNGKLFRIKERLDIPSGEKREIEIYADDPGPDMAIDPTEFTVPGLWAGLQDKVYARSNESFEYKMKVEKYVEESDIEKAITDIKFRLKQKAEQELKDKYVDKDKLIFELDENSINIDRFAEIGDEVDSFKIKADAIARIVAFNEEDVKNMARNKIYLILPQDKELSSFNENNFSYNLDNFNSEDDMATINVSFSGKMVTKKDAEIIDKDNITGLEEDQLRAYLDTLDQFSGYKIDFSPSFVKKVPRIKDK